MPGLAAVSAGPAPDRIVGSLVGRRAEPPPTEGDGAGEPGLRHDRAMDVLASRIILRPADPTVTQAFYRDDLGLAVAREFGPPETPAMVFFAGPTMIEISGRVASPGRPEMAIWLQVRDVYAEVARLAERGVPIVREPREEFWGLTEAWLADPDGTPIVLVQVPPDHPLRRDTRRFDT